MTDVFFDIINRYYMARSYGYLCHIEPLGVVSLVQECAYPISQHNWLMESVWVMGGGI